MDEDVRLSISSGSDGQLPMSSMHRVSSLESDHTSPRELVEVRSEFSGSVCRTLRQYRDARARNDERTSKRYVVEMLRSLNSLDRSTNVELSNVVVEVGDSGMSFVVRAKDGSSFVSFVGSIDVRDCTPSRQSLLQHSR